MSTFNPEANFRDLGGIETKDGRFVKKGLLYRSAAPGIYMNEEELKQLNSLDLAILLDLRTPSEIKANPDPHFPHTANIAFSALPRSLKSSMHPDEVASIVRHGYDLPASYGSGLRDMYRRLPFHNKAYRELFHMLLDGAVPVLFHCSEGKDRTGIAAILILMALGVSEERALDDYMQTNIQLKRMIDAFLNRYRDIISLYPETEEYFTSYPGVSVDNAILAMNTVLDQYHSWHTFFQKEYGLGPEEIHRLRAMYLEWR